MNIVNVMALNLYVFCELLRSHCLPEGNASAARVIMFKFMSKFLLMINIVNAITLNIYVFL